MPFQKGTSGNPKGRTRGARNKKPTITSDSLDNSLMENAALGLKNIQKMLKNPKLEDSLQLRVSTYSVDKVKDVKAKKVEKELADAEEKLAEYERGGTKTNQKRPAAVLSLTSKG